MAKAAVQVRAQCQTVLFCSLRCFLGQISRVPNRKPGIPPLKNFLLNFLLTTLSFVSVAHFENFGESLLCMQKEFSKKTKSSSLFRPVAQENPLGCAVACVASLCHLSYQEALLLFENPENAWVRGFYCEEVMAALSKMKLSYDFSFYDHFKHRSSIHQPGILVFIEPCPLYPAGHYFLRVQGGWMNPWSNFPQMRPVISEIQTELPGRISHVLFPSVEGVS